MAPVRIGWFHASMANTAPTVPNKTLSLTKLNARSLEISWEKATDKETPQDKLQYVVIWSPFPYHASKAKSSNPMIDATTYRLTGLLPKTAYEIRVFVFDGTNTVQYNPMRAMTAPDPEEKTLETGSWFHKRR